ncbi:MAG: 5-demethoxyubiquinol-8 5-hydroxylase UbiM [Proteobacteria bacterium]|jgi:ubiquinone biosynthesis UbiH/UbiF/VisC/COQ6 family hydroxylase|nr:5-demethoxyubiquinol-8 5-hydroxylase UbiM [Pseudomonadota bacterium]
MSFDLLILGAGPAGLCLARALSGRGLSIGVVEQQPLEALSAPAFDGREIALTQRSAETLRRLGLWERIGQLDDAALSPLRDAQVMNGPFSPFALRIGHELTRREELGWLVSNHLIRRAAFDEAQASGRAHGDLHWFTGQPVAQVRVHPNGARIQLADGSQQQARLLIAADSRFSSTRRAVGIGASQHDFGRTMLVCQMTHAIDHAHVAWEWFGHGQTLALLPMNDDPATGAHRASAVLTLPHQEIEALLALDDAAFGEDVTRRFEQRLGAMHLASTRHAYPLVGVYPHQLVAERLACVGDAAVGMHPVTAHGFNFGLLGVETLSGLLLDAHARGQDIGAPALLARYQRQHRLATRPLYELTRLIAELYTAESPPARLLREAALRVAERVKPFKRLVAGSLAGT